MDNLVKEGEQMFDNNNNNQGGGNDNSFGNDNQQQQDNNNQQQSSSRGGGGGGFMKSMESTTEDAYINQEANKFLNKEGVPNAADGVIDGAIDAEANKLQKEY